MNRRNAVRAITGGLLARSLRAAPQPLTPAEFARRLKGPILSFPTVYTDKYDVDFEAIGKIIEQGVKAGVKVVALTNGNSHYASLSLDEIRQLTRATVDAVRGRALVIAATGPWWTRPAVEYAQYASRAGADAVQVLMPPEGSTSGYRAHFEAVARSVSCPIVIHGKPSLELLTALAKIENVVGFKEEFTPEYTLQIYQAFGQRFAIFAGGSKARLLTYRPYGMQAYYSAFSTFAPQIAMRFWGAVEANDMNAAKEIVLRYDVPFFERWSFPFWAATLEHFGLARRFVRPPAESFNDAQMREVAAFYRSLNLG